MQLTQSSPTKTLPVEITSYDLLKTFAVITMVIDHIGIYLYPDQLWFRTIGRLSFPAWLFLIGYARSRDLPLKIWIGIGLLIIGDFLVGREMFPLNILVTIALVRILIDPFMESMLKSPARFWTISIALLVIALPTNLMSEYGALAIITAIFGYLVRNRHEIEERGDHFVTKDFLSYYMIFSLFAYFIVQQILFMFSMQQFLFMAFGVTILHLFLMHFALATFPKMTEKSGTVGKYFFQICGRRTLEIYVVHLLILKFVTAGYFSALGL